MTAVCFALGLLTVSQLMVTGCLATDAWCWVPRMLFKKKLQAQGQGHEFTWNLSL